MTPELKEKLLLRQFSSLEYIEEFVNCFTAALRAAEYAFATFEKKYINETRLSGHYAMEYLQWSERVIPNFKGMEENAILALDNAKQGKMSTIRSATGNLRGLSKDMDGIGWDWWDEIDKSFRKPYSENMSNARQMGDNIYKSLSGYWRPGSILKENITGPLNEKNLFKYLQPGESAN